jgi:hypothetical protein
MNMKMMRRLAAALIALGWLTAGTAGATNAPVCCACIEESWAHEGGGGPAQAPPATAALFCAASASRSTEQALSERCSDLSGTLICLADGSAPCRVELANEGYICPPGAAGAPLLSPLVLGGLTLALAGLGIGLTRRLGRAA